MSRSKRPGKQQPAEPGRASGVARRAFLLGTAGATGVAALGWLLWGRGSRERWQRPHGEAPSPSPVSFLPRASVPLLRSLADLVVPAWQCHPAASESELLPGLERVVGGSPVRADFYQRKWPALERSLAHVMPLDGGRLRADAALPLLQQWFEEYRRVEVPSEAAHMFEVLRRDVLRVYYASPAGWQAVGYEGPVRRAHPRRRGDA